MSIQGPQTWKVQDSRDLEIHNRMGPPAPPLCSAIVSADANTSFELDRQSMGRLHRFQTRTIFTLGSSVMVNLFTNGIMKYVYLVSLSLKHPSLTMSTDYYHNHQKYTDGIVSRTPI